MYAIIQELKYVWCVYAIMPVYRFTDIEVSTLQVWKYGNNHV